MANGIFSTALDGYNKFQSFTNTDTAKQKVIQTVAFAVVLNAAYNASRTRLTQASISMTAATVLWMNQEAFLHKALSENVEALHKGGSGLLKDQASQLEDLKRERTALEAQVRQLDETRQLIQQQVASLEATRKLFDEHIARTSASLNAAIQQQDPHASRV